MKITELSLNKSKLKANQVTEVKDKRLLKTTPMEREKLIFVDNSYNVYVGGIVESLQRGTLGFAVLRY